MIHGFSGEVLVLGCGSLARRRVLPALLRSSAVRVVHIASRSAEPTQGSVCGAKAGNFWSGYDQGLKALPARSLVYVSLPNSLHFPWALRALERGHHVVIDKPAVLEVAHAEQLVQVAARDGLCCAEANVWVYHPLAAGIRRAVEGRAIVFAQAEFANPPLAADNYRYQVEYGGGVLLDRASYLLSCGELLFQEQPKSADVRVLARSAAGVDLAVSITATYSGGRVVHLFSAWNCEYSNRLRIFTPGLTVSAERLFSPPSDWQGSLLLQQEGREVVQPVEVADSFECFLDAVCADSQGGRVQKWGEQLVAYARGLECITRMLEKTL